MRKRPDAKKESLYNPSTLMVSILSTDLRANTGVQPTGNLVNFYETYITSPDHFKRIVDQTYNESGKGVSNIAAVSIEGIFSPYSTKYGSDGDFPSFEVPSSTDLDATSLFLNPYNPLNIFGTGIPDSGFGQRWMDSGHNILMSAVGSGLGQPTGISPSGSGYHADPHSFIFDVDYAVRGKVETADVRSVGLRSPMVLTGWGFDTEGNPVPSSGGAIHPDAFRDPKTWKTGPVDLRWDDDRKVWTGGTQVKIYLIKVTNEYTPSCFSYEVDRTTSRSQYTRVTLTPREYSTATGTLPEGVYPFPETGIYDPEYVAYNANSANSGCFERMYWDNVEYPYYEAFIVRETNLDPVPSQLYNIWTEDCNDCGHITNPCGAGTNHGSLSTGKKVLIENPLRQSFNAGDLAFSVKTGRKKAVYTGGFTGGSGVGASGQFTTDADGNLSFSVTNGGSGYTYGAFPVYNEPCTGLTLHDDGSVITSGTINGVTTGYLPNQTYAISVIPKNATSATEQLDIHWILQSEFKSQQIVTHVEASAGVLQTCTTKIQTQGFKSCEHCGENTSLINNFI